MTAPNDLYVVEGGDHSLVVRKSDLAARAETQEEVDQKFWSESPDFVRAYSG